MLEVRDVAIAIVPELNAEGENEWIVYFINMKNYALDAVLINAEGKGIIDGEERRTAVMRFFIDKAEPCSAKKLEILMPEAFVLNNQYWVSFYEGPNICDKKFVFDANTIDEANLVSVPLINRPGIYVK